MKVTLSLVCLVAGCKEQVAGTDMDIAVTLFRAHISTHTTDTSRHQGGDSGRSVKWVRPRITQGTSMDSWQSFQVLWNLYKSYTDVSEVERSLQLMQCCDKKLLVQILQSDPNVLNKSELEQFGVLRRLAVVPANRPWKGGELVQSPFARGEGQVNHM